MRRLPHCRLAPILALLAAALLLASCGKASGFMLEGYLEDHQAELSAPLDPQGAPVRFEVAPGTPAQVIGKDLMASGLIADDLLFEAYVRVNNLATRLEAGSFILSPSMTLVEIVDELQNAMAQGLVVAIPEGWRLEQSADRLAAGNIFSDTVGGVSAQAETYRQIGISEVPDEAIAARHPYLEQRPAGATLEGYLFPDSYELDADNPLASDLIGRQLDTFAARVVPLYAEARQQGRTPLTLHEVITLASIVEREAVIAAERPTIAGVYLNRLADGVKLDADPTVQYAMGFQAESGQWWKTPVTLEEYTSVVSPYNTYLNTGLPPGPIASPGLSSIEAVLNPEQHDFLYFVALPDKSGAHVFATTYEEHLLNVQRYLGQ